MLSSRHHTRQLTAWLAGAGLFTLTVVSACGGSSEDDDFSGSPTGSGGSAGSSAGSAGSAGNAGSPTGSGGGPAPVGGSGGLMGMGGMLPFPMLDGGAGECLNCVTMSCPDAQACFMDPACVQGALCAATTCTQGDGGTDQLACWLGCFGGDTQAALSAFTAFSCVLTSCGDGCSGALGG